MRHLTSFVVFFCLLYLHCVGFSYCLLQKGCVITELGYIIVSFYLKKRKKKRIIEIRSAKIILSPFKRKKCFKIPLIVVYRSPCNESFSLLHALSHTTAEEQIANYCFSWWIFSKMLKNNLEKKCELIMYYQNCSFAQKYPYSLLHSLIQNAKLLGKHILSGSVLQVTFVFNCRTVCGNTGMKVWLNHLTFVLIPNISSHLTCTFSLKELAFY